MEKEISLMNKKCMAIDSEKFPLHSNVKAIVAAFNESVKGLSDGDAAVAEGLFLKRASPSSILAVKAHNYEEQFAVAFYLGSLTTSDHTKVYYLHMNHYVAFWIANDVTDRSTAAIPAWLAG